MTRDEARKECAERNAQAAPGDRWLAQQTPDGGWRVVRVHLDGMRVRDPLKAAVESRPRPPQAPDPRPGANGISAYPGI